jgi:hypothetical protein
VSDTREPLTPDDECRIGGQLFSYVHEIEARFGLPGVRYIKRWALEKLPFKAFARGYFDDPMKGGGEA